MSHCPTEYIRHMLDEIEYIEIAKQKTDEHSFLNDETLIIFTMPNADENGSIIADHIKAFCKKHKNCIWFFSLGIKNYLSLIQFIDVAIGNSSSAIYEVPYFRKPTVNIGTRQSGRIDIPTIIDCDHDKEEIKNAIEKSLSKSFITKIKSCDIPIGSDKTFDNILSVLRNIELENLFHKKFHDL